MLENESPAPEIKKPILPVHYHGTIVRRLFLIAGIAMMATLPFFSELIFLPSFISVLGIVIIAFLAGLESPEKRWVLVLNTAIASLACALFEYQAVHFYVTSTTDTTLDRWFFWVNQGLAIIFFLALYYSSKTLRAPDRPKS